MGTRNLTMVLLNNEIKVAQYCQWDGHITGQGQIVYDFLKNILDLNKLKQAINDCRFLTELELSYRFSDVGINSNMITIPQGVALTRVHPALSRDTGARILELIQNKNVRELQNDIDFAGDSVFCEFAYLLDLDNERLEVYRGFQKMPLLVSDRFFELTKISDLKPVGEQYYPIKLRKTFTFNDLRNITFEKFHQLFAEEDNKQFEIQATLLKEQAKPN